MTAEPIRAPREPERDYASEMRRYIEDNLPDGDVVLSTHAEWMIRKLQQKDPDLLMGWLMHNAVVLLSDYIRVKVVRGNRKAIRRVSKAFTSGDSEGVRPNAFELDRYVIDTDNTWRLLGDMTGKDHRFVADDYDRRSKEMAMLAAFHRAVAKRVGAKTTAEVLTVEQYEHIWKKMVGG